MLALKQALSLPSIKTVSGDWIPPALGSLFAWYKNSKGITLSGSDVSQWDDSSTYFHHMEQGVADQQPAYSSGVLTFVRADENNLSTGVQISLTADFTIGIKIAPAIAAAGTFLGDYTSAGELFKYASTTRITVKIAGSSGASLDLDSGTFGNDYLVITRISDVLTLWHNGVEQTGTTPTVAGTALIDAISMRYNASGPVDFLDGTIEEIIIYNTASAAITAGINTRLATL